MGSFGLEEYGGNRVSASRLTANHTFGDGHVANQRARVWANAGARWVSWFWGASPDDSQLQ